MSDRQAVDITELATLAEQFPFRLMQLGFRLFQMMDTAGHDLFRYIVPPVCEVPAGSFLMGSNPLHDPQACADEIPQHEIVLPAFQIGIYPVTVAEYACALQVGAVAFPEDDNGPPPLFYDEAWREQCHQFDHPVGGVLWKEAAAYAGWLTKVTQQPWRLPTEAEWEKAARGTDGRIYPWGDDFDGARTDTHDSGPRVPPPMAVGACPQRASPYGVQDMVGNVWQWISDRNLKHYPYQSGAAEEADTTRVQVIRGSCWHLQDIRIALRNTVSHDYSDFVFGMRLVLDMP